MQPIDSWSNAESLSRVLDKMNNVYRRRGAVFFAVKSDGTFKFWEIREVSDGCC